MNQEIYPCFIIREKAEAAGHFYASVFEQMKVASTDPLVTILETNGQKIMLLNDGPQDPLNQTVSIMVMCDREEQIDEYWNRLAFDATVRMEYNTYPWAKKYGWVKDKYGMEWQLYFGDAQAYKQKFVPTLMFCGAQNGKAEEAMNFYTSIFQDSEIDGIMKHAQDGDDIAGNIAHAEFNLDDFKIGCMDSSHEKDAAFNDSASLVVITNDQAETDKFWEALLSGGGQESMCGWLKDKYGFSWQITPARLLQLISNPQTSKSAMEAMLKMRKIDIATLEHATN